MKEEDINNEKAFFTQQQQRKKRPEMARYQPPSSRVNSQPIFKTTEQNISADVNNPTILESKTIIRKEFNKSSSAGLLKLNEKTLNELINKSDNMNLNEKEDKEDSKSKHILVKSSHSNRFQAQQNIDTNKNESLNENLKYRTLFDPDNPEKPIYVGIPTTRPNTTTNLNSNNSNNQKKQITSQKEKRDTDKPGVVESKKLEIKIDESVTKVNALSINIQQLEAKLKNFIENFDSSQSLNQFLTNVNPLRKQIEKLCIDSLFINLETSSNLNIDLNHWRSCYHHLIETLRKEFNNKSDPKNLKDSLSKILQEYIEEGVNFYKNLIETLETKYLKFKSNSYIDLNYYEKTLEIVNSQTSNNKLITVIKSKDMKYALICINRLLICLGDLERYREMIFPSQQSNQRDYSMARFYYLKAMCLAPKSSRAYHQLAILAIYTKRRLDACYYYFRCLEVNSPLSNVRQSLNSIFEEVRIKSDSINKMIKNAILNHKEKLKQNKTENINNKNRVEIWYKPIFSSNTVFNLNKKNETDSSDDDHDDNNDNDELDQDLNEEGIYINENEKKLSLNELNKRFMLNYLNTIGKLFTKVGMESYDEVCSNMLKEFNELLRRSPSPLGKMRLLQINTINISIIDLIYKSANHLNPDGGIVRSQLLENAIQLSIDIFSLIANRFNSLIKKCRYLSGEVDDLSLETELEWNQLFPSIKIFLDWMLCNLKLWNPLPDQLSLDLGPNPNRWEILITLFNLINKNINKFENANIRDDYYKIKLEEDLELAGFVPLLSLPKEDYDYQNSIQINFDYIKSYLNEKLVEKEKIRKRMQKILLFADYLCGLEQPLVKYDVLNKCYDKIESNAITKTNKPSLNKRTISTGSSTSIKSSHDNNLEAPLNEVTNNQNEQADELNELKEKHRLLKQKMFEQQKQEQKIQSLLEANSKRQIELEIRPKFIVADTNCFIDHLNLIDKILNTNYYILIVPILVINELEKLSKSISYLNDDSIEHAEYLQKNAKKSIEFLNNKFEKRDRNIKAMTSQGSVLETIQFRTEEVVKPGSNDELILGCCLYYCRDNARDFMPNNKNDAIHLYRDVVLLTEDRHLKLKAHTRNVPVKDIKHFCKWSGLFSISNEKSNKKF